jgi:hypothetical protein
MARTGQSEPNARREALEEKPAALKRLAVGGSIPSLATIHFLNQRTIRCAIEGRSP